MPLCSKLIPTSNPSGTLIGYKNLLVATTTTDGEKALIPNTYERMAKGFAGFQAWKFQLASATNIDFIAMAGHNFAGQTNMLLRVASTIGGALTTVAVISSPDDRAIFETFLLQSVAEISIEVNWNVNPELAVIYAGETLQMPTNIYGGHSPINLSQKTDYQSPMSESGQFLGRNIIRKGLESNFSWQHLEPSFYRDEFQPFVESARTTPFFIKWRPDKFVNESAFGYTTSDITPTNSGGGNDLMSVSMVVRAHSDT